MCEAGERADDSQSAKSGRDIEHEKRNRSQAELLKAAYRRKQHADYIDAMLRRAAAANDDTTSAGGGNVDATGTRPDTPAAHSEEKD